MANCGICKRELDQRTDPLSSDCGGDCWGCISEIEADMLDLNVFEYRKSSSRGASTHSPEANLLNLHD